MGDAIVTTGLGKRFGSVDAVKDLTLTIDIGEIFGFLGPNGSGKSTTIRLLLDEIRPTSGSATVLGLDAHRDVVDVHRRVGYLPGEFALPPEFTAEQFLDHLSRLRNLDDRSARDEIIERLDLDPTRRLGQLSTGNRQKVGLVQAFMHRPELVLLDEPITGLDPLIQHEFHSMLREFVDVGMSVFLSSHTLSEVDRVADRVGILRAGQLVTVDSVSVLKSRAVRRIDLEFVRPPTPQAFEGVPGVRHTIGDGNHVRIVIEGSVHDVLRRAVELGTIVSVRTPEVDLEDVFLDYYRDPQGTGWR